MIINYSVAHRQAMELHPIANPWDGRASDIKLASMVSTKDTISTQQRLPLLL